MAVELSAAEVYFAAVLSNDPTLASLGVRGYYSEQAPNDSDSPYIIWSMIGASDVPGANGVRINMTAIYIIRVIDRVRNFSSLRATADRIDTLLHRSSGVALGHMIDACVREAPYSFVQNKGDLEWRHLGGRYRVWVSA